MQQQKQASVQAGQAVGSVSRTHLPGEEGPGWARTPYVDKTCKN